MAVLFLYDEINQHRSIYGSYNTELLKIKSIKLENASNTSSSFKSVKLDTSDALDKYLLYSQFVAWYRKGLSIVPLSDYEHNPVYQELPKLNNYFTNADEKIFIDLRLGKKYTNQIQKINREDSDLLIRITFKAAATKKNAIVCNWILSR